MRRLLDTPRWSVCLKTIFETTNFEVAEAALKASLKGI
jgi:hypothetical protein